MTDVAWHTNLLSSEAEVNCARAQTQVQIFLYATSVHLVSSVVRTFAGVGHFCRKNDPPNSVSMLNTTRQKFSFRNWLWKSIMSKPKIWFNTTSRRNLIRESQNIPKRYEILGEQMKRSTPFWPQFRFITILQERSVVTARKCPRDDGQTVWNVNLTNSMRTVESWTSCRMYFSLLREGFLSCSYDFLEKKRENVLVEWRDEQFLLFQDLGLGGKGTGIMSCLEHGDVITTFFRSVVFFLASGCCFCALFVFRAKHWTWL